MPLASSTAYMSGFMGVGAVDSLGLLALLLPAILLPMLASFGLRAVFRVLVDLCTSHPRSTDKVWMAYKMADKFGGNPVAYYRGNPNDFIK